MTIPIFANNRLVRMAGLLVLLSITVLTALWQQTSASSGFSPEATFARRLATPAPSATPTPAPTPAPTKTPAPKPAATLSGFVVPNPSSLDVVVNKQRALPLAYVPANLVVPNVALRYSAGAEQSHLRAEAAAAMEQMFSGAAQNGVNLVLVSGYRSAAYQTTIYNNAVRSSGVTAADQGVARPGHSEHQTGLAADLGRPDRACEIDSCFGATPEGLWLQAHAHEYGFIISYSAAKHSLTGYEYEPWHIRFTGAGLATQLHDSGQTLEEYFGLPFAPTY